jgi:NADPH:quinone reductase-like Zn-dependent oxidoreductase
MKAFAIDELGLAGSVRDIAVPEPAEGQVRVRVAAAGLNPFDAAVVQGQLKDRMEHRFPLVPGMDASGTVEAVGKGVTGWSVGEEVFGSVGRSYLGEGTLAEFATMSERTVARKHASLDHAAAAAVPVAAVTALTMVDAFASAAGGVVVAIGATGGVGGYLVQLAARRGARVVAVCSGGNADYARRLGAVDVVDYTAEDMVEAVGSRYPDGIQGIADMHGDREVLARLAEQVRAGGHVTSAVGAADADALAQRGIGATNVQGRVNTASLEALATMLERGEIQSPELQRYSLTDAAQALAAVGSGHVRGKIVVVPA